MQVEHRELGCSCSSPPWPWLYGGAERTAGARRSQSTLSVSGMRGGDISLSGTVTATFGAHVFAVGSGVGTDDRGDSRPIDAVTGDGVDVTGQPRAFRREELESKLGVDLG